MTDDILALKTKIEKAKGNSMLTDSQKATLLEKYTKQLDELERASEKREEKPKVDRPKSKLGVKKSKREPKKEYKTSSETSIEDKIERVKKNSMLTASQKEALIEKFTKQLPSKSEKQEVVKEVKKAIKEPKAVTKDSFNALLNRLIKKFPEYAEFKGYTKEAIKRDAQRMAKLKGKRVSKNGKTYYEYRTNRTDVIPKDKLAKGGIVKRDIAKDKTIKAKHKGWRTSADGKEYYEARPNRSDKDLRKKF
jgi:hypothetical protein